MEFPYPNNHTNQPAVLLPRSTHQLLRDEGENFKRRKTLGHYRCVVRVRGDEVVPRRVCISASWACRPCSISLAATSRSTATISGRPSTRNVIPASHAAFPTPRATSAASRPRAAAGGCDSESKNADAMAISSSPEGIYRVVGSRGGYGFRAR